VSASNIAAGQVVKSVNGLKDAVTLAAGNNITVSTVGSTVTIASPPATTAFFDSTFSAIAGTGVAVESSCASGTVVHGSCGYINLDSGVFDVRVAYAGPSGANWRCVVYNAGAVARTIHYGVTCTTALTAVGSPLPTESQARSSSAGESAPGIVVRSIQFLERK
jgi:hypothetical protein